jgi:hypothetical protein
MIGLDKAQASALGLDVVRRIEAAVFALPMQADFSRPTGAHNPAAVPPVDPAPASSIKSVPSTFVVVRNRRY